MLGSGCKRLNGEAMKRHMRGSAALIGDETRSVHTPLRIGNPLWRTVSLIRLKRS
jgi:hypothetical protein